MYNGNNPTALNSRDWLVQALLSLMNSMPYSKITVKNICTKADLSRQTFYNFFETKDDIIRFCIQKCYEEMISHLSKKTSLQLTDIIEKMAQTFNKNQKLIQLIINQHLDNLLETEIAAAIHLFTKYVKLESNDSLSEYGDAFLIGAISHTILYWFKNPSPITVDQLSNLLFQIFSGNYFVIEK